MNPRLHSDKPQGTGFFCAAAMAFVVGLLLTPLAHAGEQAVRDATNRIKEQNYREALSIVSRALGKSDLEAEDRYELLMLRGESLLQLGSKAPAKRAFDAAAD